MPTDHYGLYKLAKQTKVHPKAAFVSFLRLILRQNTMSEEEHSDSEFYYPDELESHKENGEATALSGYEQLYENSREEIESFVEEQKSENTTRKTFSDMKTFQRYFSSVNKGNVELLDLAAGDLDHLLPKFFKNVRKIITTSINLTRCLVYNEAFRGCFSMANLHSTFSLRLVDEEFEER